MRNFAIDEIVIALILIILFFLLLRSVNLWYWKINTLIKNQEETNKLLQKIAGIEETGEVEEEETPEETAS